MLLTECVPVIITINIHIRLLWHNKTHKYSTQLLQPLGHKYTHICTYFMHTRINHLKRNNISIECIACI